MGVVKDEGGRMKAEKRKRYKPYPKYKDSGVEWLGEIPEEWESRRLKFAAALNPSCPEIRKFSSDTEVSFVPMEAIGEYGGLELTQTKSLAEVGSGYTCFRNGDVVVAKITPCFENGKGALATGLSNETAFGTTELHVLRARELDPGFLFYITMSHAFRCLGEAEMYGAGGQKRIPESFVEDFRQPLPKAWEQQKIVTFLDRATARIDALVAKKERLIELLQEKRAALITQAVTKGLDPNISVKNSGIEWPTEIPVNWEVKPFTKYTIEKSDYRGKTPEKVASGVFLVTARNVRMGFIDYECSQEYVSELDYEEIMRRGKPKKGDLLFTTEAPLGNVAIVDREDIALAQRIIRFRMNPRYFDNRFCLYSIVSDYFQAQLITLSTGSTAEGLKASKLPTLRIISPQPTEQRAIAAFLDTETAKIDSLIVKIRQAIDYLKEYRTALISAAVTGKIDVRQGGGMMDEG